MKFFILLSLVALTFALRFDGDQVLTLYPKTPAHLRLIEEFDSYDTLADFWSPDNAVSVRIGGSVDIRFKSGNLFAVKKKLTNAKMQFDVKIGNLQSLVDTQFNMPRKFLDGYNYDVYHSYDEINDWSKDITAAYPNLITREVLIVSEEGREIPKLTIGTEDNNNPIVLIDCGIHAREWISPAFCQYLVNRIVSEEASMLNKLTFVVLPLLNVDGYEYTWTNDRMWRKTRSDHGNICIGVDPNRNFDALWSGPGASASSCSETYYGPEVESEQLTKGLSNFIRANNGAIKVYLTFHSYSQVMLWPYSYANMDVDNLAEHNNLAASAVSALSDVNGKKYTYGAGWDIFYLAAGGSDDMAKDNGVPLSYTVELRDTGRYGFILPENQINPSCLETFELVRTVVNHVENN